MNAETDERSRKKPKPMPSSTQCPRSTKRKRRLPRDAKIAISGGGIGGLAVANALKQNGYKHITVYERDAHFSERRDGYGLTLSYNEKGPLAKLGLLETAARADCPSRSHYVFNPDGKVIGYYGNAFHQSSTDERRGLGQRGNLRVPRQVLRRIMMDELMSPSSSDGKAKVEWGKRLVSFEDRVNNKVVGVNSFTCDDDGDGKGAVKLTFEDGHTTEVDLLIGSDGIRSTVTRSLLSKGLSTTESSNDDGLSYLQIMIVLGITDSFAHPLLDERGFYTLDGNNRLFTMPFEGSKLDDMLNSDDMDNPTPQRRYMWQLSWHEPDEDKARKLSQAGSEALIEEVKHRCRNWHEPVLDMIQCTSPQNVFGTGLQDRDPQQLVSSMKAFSAGNQSRVVVLGDAVHAMSCFKGQGANQALADGPLLASWLEKASVDSAIRGFMREMVARTGDKVRASREAAIFLHSPSVLQHAEGFAGVQKDMVPQFLEALNKKNIGASLASALDSSINTFLKGEGKSFVSFASKFTPDGLEPECLKQNKLFREQALACVAGGDSAGLRRLSPAIIHDASDVNGRNCLHLAALGGHYHCCRYLISESSMPVDQEDETGNTALHCACKSKDAQTIQLLSAVSGKLGWDANKDKQS